MWSRGLLSVLLLALVPGGFSQEQQPEETEITTTQPPTTTTQIPPTTTETTTTVPTPPPQTCNLPYKEEERDPGPACDYAMVVPYKQTGGSEATVCVWVKSAVSVTVKVTLEYQVTSTEITEFHTEAAAEHFQCASYLVPEVENAQSFYVTLSVTGAGVEKVERKSVVVAVPRVACIAQNSKTLYRQGEMVQMRYLCYNENLKQVIKQIVSVTIVDPYGNRISQTLNPSLDHGILTITFQSSELSRVGSYSVHVEDDKGNVNYASFQIQRYELPRIEFNVNCPYIIGVLDDVVVINTTATYVTGKPVPGSVVMKCCRRVPRYGREANCYRGVPDICQDCNGELDEEGNFYGVLDLAKFNLPFSGYQDSILCEITMKEQGTGALNPSSCYMSITKRLATVQIDREKTSRYYNNINALFSATLQDEHGNPLANRLITVAIDGVNVKCLTTDENGRVECELDTSQVLKENITITAIYQDNNLCYTEPDYRYYNAYDLGFPYDQVTLFRSYSQSGSRVRLRPLSSELACHQDYSVQLDYLFTAAGVGEEATSASIIYVVLSKYKIVEYGEINVDLSLGFSGSTFIHFHTDYRYAIGAQLIAFTALKKHVASDTISVRVGACFQNEVTLAFDKVVVNPGAMVDQIVTGAPGSFCGLRGMDRSFALLGYYDEFNAYSIFSYVRDYIYDYQYGGLTWAEPEPPCIDGNTVHFCNGIYGRPISWRTDREPRQDFQDLSVLFFTNLDTRRPKVCGEEAEPQYYPYHGDVAFSKFASVEAAAAPGGAAGETIRTFRDNFADVLPFQFISLDSAGEARVPTPLPDTITKWDASAFCVSAEEGLGLTLQQATVETFQLFYVETNTPLYVTRGEWVTVAVQVANYMEDECAMVTLELEPSGDYTVTSQEDTAEKCICGGKRGVWHQQIIFQKQGTIDVRIQATTSKISATCDGPNDDNLPQYSDTIVKKFIVRWEGISREFYSSHLFSVAASSAEVSIGVVQPERLVPGSFKLLISVMGDPTALSLRFFDNLLSAPPFSCYQIVSSLQSIIFLAKYAKVTGDLDEERYKKMISALSFGYQNLLSFYNYGGYFNPYMNYYFEDPWLNPPILRLLFLMKEYIYVEENLIINGIIRISQRQLLPIGCIVPDGLSYDNKDHYIAIVRYTANTVSILVELSDKYSNAGPVVEEAKKFLATVDFSALDIETQSSVAHAIASLGEFDKWQECYITLNEEAITAGGARYWRRGDHVDLLLTSYFPRNNDGDIGITSTILLSMTMVPNPSQELRDSMGPIAAYLSGQLNQRGACQSARDTSLLIEALTRFGLSNYNGETNVQVSVHYNDQVIYSVSITETTKYLVQTTELDETFGEFTITVDGTGNTLVQFVALYNTAYSPEDESPFALGIVATPHECVGGVSRMITVTVTLSYKGNREQSGNCVLRIGLMNGYIASFPYVSPYLAPPRVEDNAAVFFIQTVTRAGTTVSTEMYLEYSILYRQPATVVIKDIDTGESAAGVYTYPCDEAVPQESA